jgi:putative sterol carrier protein/quercetin dioxygenase-like cupin family protein
MTIEGIFNEFAETFEKKIGKDFHVKVQFEIYDMENDVWQIEVNGGKVFVYNEKKIEPEEEYVLSRATLEKLYNNELSPLSAFLEEPEKAKKGELAALITPKDRNTAKEMPKKYLDKTFVDRIIYFRDFFSKDYPTKINVTNKYCIKHNGDIDTIGLHSEGMGKFAQIYTSIKKGEVLRGPATEINFYVISGNGKFIVGNNECEIKSKEYYHINPLENIQIKNMENEPLEILLLFHNLEKIN